jgi:hypothetical protein
VCGLLIQALNTSKVNILKQVCLPGHDLAGLSLLLVNLPNMIMLPGPHKICVQPRSRFKRKVQHMHAETPPWHGEEDCHALMPVECQKQIPSPVAVAKSFDPAPDALF